MASLESRVSELERRVGVGEPRIHHTFDDGTVFDMTRVELCRML